VAESGTSISEHVLEAPEHTTFYLTAGPESGPLIILVHGWPELSLSWRHQLPFLAGLGFRVVAPDMRGYGRSSVYARTEDYAQELIVGDMLQLLDALDYERAVFVGHDWGSPVVWNIASHHNERCAAVASLCVPFCTLERGIDTLVPLVDRSVYPEDEYPVGQWDYQLYYQESFEAATQAFAADPYKTLKLLFRKGDPAGARMPSLTANVRRMGGWFGGGPAPDAPRDEEVISEEDLAVYAAALERNGFFGPGAWYMNHAANGEYAARGDDRLDMPVLFLAARYDYVCEAVDSHLARPMRERCTHLSETIVDSGHWMAQEQPERVNTELQQWLVRR